MVFFPESLIKKARGKTTIVALHHPMFTNGSHGGQYAFGSHLTPLPVLGTLKNIIRKAGGVTTTDNQNKKYSKENDDLREQLEATTEPGDDGEEAKPLVAGLQMKLESQNNEILQLQKEFKKVEDKYLALYEETMADMIGMPQTEAEPSPAVPETNPKGDIVTDSSDIDDLLANANNSKPNDSDKESEDIVTDTSDIDDILASANIGKKT